MGRTVCCQYAQLKNWQAAKNTKTLFHRLLTVHIPCVCRQQTTDQTYLSTAMMKCKFFYRSVYCSVGACSCGSSITWTDICLDWLLFGNLSTTGFWFYNILIYEKNCMSFIKCLTMRKVNPILVRGFLQMMSCVSSKKWATFVNISVLSVIDTEWLHNICLQFYWVGGWVCLQMLCWLRVP